MPPMLTGQPAPAIQRVRRYRFLLIVWVVAFFSLLFGIGDALPPRVSFWACVGYSVACVGTALFGSLRERRLRARAGAAEWRLCPACLYPLEPGEGACPECGRPYSPESLEREWTNR